MLIETLSVREAREKLPSVLARFRRGERTPVGVGAHRKTEAVMIPVEVYEEVFGRLLAERTQAVREAAASVRAEGFPVDAEARAIPERWARGEISTEQMYELILRRHGVQ